MKITYLLPALLIVSGLAACKGPDNDPFNLDCDNPESGMLVHYSFDDQAGASASDCSPNRANGILNGVDWAAPDGETAIEFDGRDTFNIPLFTRNSAMQEIPSTGTISVVFRFRNSTADIQPVVYFGESDAGSPHNSLIIEVGHKMDPNDRKLYFTIVNQRFCFDSNKNLEENTWYHFVAVVGENGNTGYLNGVEMKDRHYNLGSDSTYTKFFSSVSENELFTLGYGRYGMCDDFFYLDGYISDFRVYQRALNAKEVGELYKRLF